METSTSGRMDNMLDERMADGAQLRVTVIGCGSSHTVALLSEHLSRSSPVFANVTELLRSASTGRGESV